MQLILYNIIFQEKVQAGWQKGKPPQRYFKCQFYRDILFIFTLLFPHGTKLLLSWSFSHLSTIFNKNPQNPTKQDIWISYLAVQPRALPTPKCASLEALLLTPLHSKVQWHRQRMAGVLSEVNSMRSGCALPHPRWITELCSEGCSSVMLCCAPLGLLQVPLTNSAQLSLSWWKQHMWARQHSPFPTFGSHMKWSQSYFCCKN